ncbi:cation/H(+) antiporter 15-like [Prosopis cineraria]|uniref:cation/H(+) antiporter 15-like n=1 Tax=Prosopis cineraria TaxID=364024 RepID=UPI0024102DE6|nr:cation/H(+) antiporter 15-like [Prosopis cineraria]
MSSPVFKEYSLVPRPNGTLEVCFDKQVSYGSGYWLENSLQVTMPLFALQLAVILSFNRLCILASAPWHLPRIVTDVFAGFLTSPAVLGRSTFYVNHANKAFREQKAIIVAIVGVIFSIPYGIGLYYLLLSDLGRKHMPPPVTGTRHFIGAMIWGITLSCSEFPEIARILTSLKLVLNENGQLALTSALINDVFSWIFLVISISALHAASGASIVSTFVFLLISVYVVHPLAKWLFQKVSTKDRDLIDAQVVCLLHMVLLFGFVADGLGAHSITGPYILGTITPKGIISKAVQEKVLDFVTAFMMPVFFAVLAERIHVEDFALEIHWTSVVVVVLLAFMAKILSTLAVYMLYRLPLKEGFSIGLLMNTKGIVSIIILTTGRDMLALNDQTFGVMILICWIMTIPVGPVLAAISKFTNSDIGSSLRRTMQGARPDIPLRVLACVHTSHDANVILSLLKASNPNVKSPIQVFAVELVKITNRPTTALILDDASKQVTESKSKKDLLRGLTLDSNNTQTGDNLECFENLSQAIFAEKLRVVSSYNTMHKDILHLAKQRGVTLILTTLYKQPTYDGLGAGTATARAANIVNRESSSKDEKKVVLENLVKEPPCCLGIFIDRGLGQKRGKERKLAMFYVGGADDREALSYAWRMCRHPNTKLTVVRIIWDNPSDEFDQTDEEYIRFFKFQTRDMGGSVKYLEKVVRDEKETLALLNSVGDNGYDLCIAGRGQGRRMSLAQTLDPVMEEPALGPLGDTLADLNSAAETSILIFQTQASSDGNPNPASTEYAYFEGHGDLMLRGGRMTWRASESD